MVIARGLGGIYISPKMFLKKWNKILEFGCIFLFEMFISHIKNNASFAAIASTCYEFRGHIYVSWIKF